MTDEMLTIAFNESFNICEFNGVEVKENNIVLHFNEIATALYKDNDDVVYTDEDTNEVGHHVFKLGNDTYTHVGNAVDETYAKDGDINNGVKTIKGYLALAYHPYMIHPNLRITTDPNDPGDNGMRKQAITGNYKKEQQISSSTELAKKDEYNTVSQAIVQSVTHDGVTGKFYFIGNVDQPTEIVEAGQTRTVFSGDINAMVQTISPSSNVTLGNKLIPYKAYFLGTKSGDNFPKYWKETSNDQTRTTGLWTPYSAVIISDQVIETALGKNGAVSGGVKSLEIDFSEFNPEDVTAIEQIVEEAKQNDVPVQYMNIVYDFGGNIVKKGDASLENLPEGMYIINGKKYLVK